jgi:hypothetical protein
MVPLFRQLRPGETALKVSPKILLLEVYLYKGQLLVSAGKYASTHDNSKRPSSEHIGQDLDPEALHMFDPYQDPEDLEDSAEAGRQHKTEPMEHAVTSTSVPDTIHQRFAQHSAPINPATNHLAQGWFEATRPDDKNSSEPRYANPVLSPSRLESGESPDQLEPGHGYVDEKGIHLWPFHFPHPHWSKRLSLSGAGTSPKNATKTDSDQDQRKTLEQDNAALIDSYAEGCPLQRWPSRSSSGDNVALDERSRDEHLGFIKDIRRRSSELRHHMRFNQHKRSDELVGQRPEPVQTKDRL